MAVGGRLPVMRAVGMAYRDVYRAYRAMPALLLIALAITLTFGFVQAFGVSPNVRSGPLSVLTGLVVGAAQSFFLTPVLIAIHRYILIDEVTQRYDLAFQSLRFQRFFIWSAVLLALNAAVSLIVELMVVAGASAWVTGGLVVVLSIVALLVSLRLTILFPAIAVDAPGASPAEAFADTKGHAFGIFLIGLGAILPLVVIMVLVGATAALSTSTIAGDSAPGVAATIAAQVLLGLIGMPLFVAIASRIFQALADQVLRHTDA